VKSKSFLAALVVIGAGWHLFLWSLGRTPELRSLAGDEQTYWARAEILLAGGEPEVDLLWPPLYARFLAVSSSPLGRPSRLAVEAVQVLLLAAAAFLLARFGRREGLPGPWAAAAGAALFLLPTPAAFAHYFWPEVLHLALFLGALELLRSGPRWWAATAAGVLLGLALLTKSVLTGFLPVLLLADFLAAGKARRWPRLAAILAGLLFAVAPTLWRNQAATGRLTIADSSTFNLWVGLNDVTRQSHAGSIAWRELQAWRASAPTFAERDAILRGRIREKIEADGIFTVLGRQLGRQYFRLFEKDSYLTDMLPSGALEPEGQGYRRMSPALASFLRGLAWSSHILLLALAGLGLALQPAPSLAKPWSWLAPAFLAYNLLIFLGLHVKSRYLLQMLPCLLLAAAWAGSRLLAAARGGEKIEPWRLAAGAAAGALLTFFATAGPWLDRAANSP
jgi:hypothetical protein